MSFTRRAVLSATDNSGTPAASLAVAAYSQASGDLLTVYVKWEGSAGTCTVADTANGSLTGLTAAFDAGTNTHSQLFYKINSSSNGSNVVTATFSLNSTYLGVYVARYIPAATAALVASTNNTGAAFSDPSVGSITAADLGIFGVSETSGQNAAPGTNWSEQIDDGTVIGAHFFDRIDSPGGTITGTCTITSQPPWQGVVASFSDLSGTPPTITDVDTDEVITSTQTGVVWSGTFFGSSQGGSTANLVQGTTTVPQTVTSWASTSITTTTVFDSGSPHLKYGTANANVNIIGNGTANLSVYINPPDARSWIDLVSINPVTTERVVSTPDIAIGDQLEVTSVKGGTISDVTLNDDGSWNAAASVTEFNFRVWSSADSTWGASAPQSTVVAVAFAPKKIGRSRSGGTDWDLTIREWAGRAEILEKWFDRDLQVITGGNITIALTGNSATFSLGTLTPNFSLGLSGKTGTFSIGALAPGIDKALTGDLGVFSPGTMSTGGDLVVGLTGQAGTFSTGVMVPGLATALIGATAAATLGTLAKDADKALTGAAILATLGSLTPNLSIGLLGKTGTWNVGIITQSGADAPPPNTSATGFMLNVGTFFNRR